MCERGGTEGITGVTFGLVIEQINLCNCWNDLRLRESGLSHGGGAGTAMPDSPSLVGAPSPRCFPGLGHCPLGPLPPSTRASQVKLFSFPSRLPSYSLSFFQLIGPLCPEATALCYFRELAFLTTP